MCLASYSYASSLLVSHFMGGSAEATASSLVSLFSVIPVQYIISIKPQLSKKDFFSILSYLVQGGSFMAVLKLCSGAGLMAASIIISN